MKNEATVPLIIVAILFMLAAVVAFGLFTLEHSDPKVYEADSCERVTEGIFGPRLCGYNINTICIGRQAFSTVSPLEERICNRYFELTGF